MKMNFADVKHIANLYQKITSFGRSKNRVGVTLAHRVACIM